MADSATNHPRVASADDHVGLDGAALPIDLTFAGKTIAMVIIEPDGTIHFAPAEEGSSNA